jgi:hypothetical protein
MAGANPVRYYLTHTLGIPAVASRAITEEGLEQFEDLIGISDEQVQAIKPLSRTPASASMMPQQQEPQQQTGPTSPTNMLPESVSWCFVAGICIGSGEILMRMMQPWTSWKPFGSGG